MGLGSQEVLNVLRGGVENRSRHVDLGCVTVYRQSWRVKGEFGKSTH